MCLLDPVLDSARRRGRNQTEQAHWSPDFGDLLRFEPAQRTKHLRKRNGDETLRVERSGLEKGNPNRGFEARVSRTRRVWHQSDEGAVGSARRGTYHEGWSNLGR